MFRTDVPNIMTQTQTTVRIRDCDPKHQELFGIVITREALGGLTPPSGRSHRSDRSGSTYALKTEPLPKDGVNLGTHRSRPQKVGYQLERWGDV